MQFSGAPGIAQRQPLRKKLDWMQHRFERKTIAQPSVILRRERDAAGQRADVEARASRDDCVFATPVDRADSIERVARISRRRITFEGIEKPDEMVRHGRKLLRRWRRRT